MSTGMVYLVDDEGNVVKYCGYTSKSERNKKIQIWKKMVGPAFNKLYVQIYPIPKKERPNETYIKRPKAVYSNKQHVNLTQEHT